MTSHRPQILIQHMITFGLIMPLFLSACGRISGIGQGPSLTSTPQEVPPGVTPSSTPIIRPAHTLTPDAIIQTPLETEGVHPPPGSFGYLLVGSREFPSLRVLDLTGDEPFYYRTIEWEQGEAMDLASSVNQWGWVALRSEYAYLDIYQLPAEDARASIWLLHEDLFKPPSEPDSFPHTQYNAVTGSWASPKWSPLEPVVAFAAAMEDAWVSIYCYDTRTEEVTRLTDAQEFAIPLGWSPDGRYLAYVTGEDFDRHGYKPLELHFLELESGTIATQLPSGSQYPLRLLGWISDDVLVYAEERPDGLLAMLTMIEISTQKTRTLADYPFRDAAISAANQRVLISYPEGQDSVAVLMALTMDGDTYLQDIVLGGEVGATRWYPGLGSFGVESRGGTALISADGDVKQVFPEERCLPNPSPDGYWFAFGPCEAFYDTELRVYTSQGERRMDFGIRARDVEWWSDSQGLLFTRLVGGIGIADLSTGAVEEAFYISGWDLMLIDEALIPFDELPFKPQPAPTSTPVTEPQASTTPNPVPPPDPKLAHGAELTILELHMQDANRGWALGRGAGDRFDRVLYTMDGGKSWLDVTPPKDPAPSEEYLVGRAYGPFQRAALFALDAEQAWVTYAAPTNLSEVIIWRTRDGGRSWSPSEPANIRELDKYGPWVNGFLPIAIDFADPQHGWIQAITELPGLMMSADTVLLRTEDGGQHWVFIHGSSTKGPEGMRFLNRDEGWRLETGDQPEWSNVLHTEDGGENWYNDPGLPVGYQASEMRPAKPCMGSYELEVLPGGWLKMIVWCSNRGLLEGTAIETYENRLYLSSDGGRSWNFVPLPVDQRPDVSLSTDFITDRVGWLLAYENGVLYQTTDGGRSWRTLKKIAWEGELHFVDHLHGWAIAWEKNAGRYDRELSLVRTTDGGYTWELIQPEID